MQIGVRHQCQEPRALDCGAQLALETRLGAGDARRDQFAVFADEFLEDVQVLVIHFGNLFSSKAAELAALEQRTRRAVFLVIFFLKYTSHFVLLIPM